MISFLKRLFGENPKRVAPPSIAPARPPVTPARKPPAKPVLPTEQLDAFKTWFFAQTRPAVALIPEKGGLIGTSGSRLGGPAWLAEGDSWPVDRVGVPLEFLAQLDCADCRSLGFYPENGIIQFFIGRDDLFGADFDDPLGANFLVRWCDTTSSGALTASPPLQKVNGIEFSDYSPFESDAQRTSGVALRAESFVDRIDPSIKEAEERIKPLYDQYDIPALDEFLESDEVVRPMRHHTGGYPAYTQSDVHYQLAFAEFDHVLLRLTSDNILMWGDVGECVFLIRSDDLKRGDFSRVAYSWDCH
jgi:uncharacterized protein YwqG